MFKKLNDNWPAKLFPTCRPWLLYKYKPSCRNPNSCRVLASTPLHIAKIDANNYVGIHAVHFIFFPCGYPNGHKILWVLHFGVQSVTGFVYFQQVPVWKWQGFLPATVREPLWSLLVFSARPAHFWTGPILDRPHPPFCSLQTSYHLDPKTTSITRRRLGMWNAQS